jgi:hypothetical protein
MLAPELLLVTTEDWLHHRQAYQRLDIADVGERRMAEWRRLYPEDIKTEQAL